MKRVLVIAYFFPPIPAIGGMRPLGFCRYLGQHGWEPTVLTTDPSSLFSPKEADPSLAERVPPGLRVMVVPHGNPLRTLLRARRAIAEGAGVLKPREPAAAEDPGAGGQGAGPLRRGIEQSLDALFAFPDREVGWLGPAVARGLALRPEERPDVVFATGGPWTSLLVGRRISSQLGIPLVADFRDPWTANPFASPGESPGLRRKAESLERGVWEAASGIVWNTDEMLERFRAEHPEHAEKCVAITNGYDDDAVAGPPGGAAAPSRPGEGRPIELAHFGTVYGSRNPVVLLQALSDLLDAGRVAPDSLRLTFVGPWEVADPRCEALAGRLEERGIVRREPPVARDESLRRMAASPLLLLLQGGFPLQIPAKVYEYVASGRPIVYIGGEGATGRLVAEHGLGRTCRDDAAEIERFLVDLASGAVRIEPPKREAVARFHYRVLTGRLAQVLEAARVTR